MASITASPSEVVARAEEILASRQTDRIGEVFHPDVVNHSLAPNRPAGLAGTEEYLRSDLHARFAGEKWGNRIEVTDGEYVVHFGTREGRWPGGNFLGIDAPAGDYSRGLAFIYRVANGLIVERWAYRDDLGFLRQLGVTL
ncbi:MAG: ester cyclase [Actinomycetota bacterium]|nr:ester cyclase [Actinomycetota bacterium]